MPWRAPQIWTGATVWVLGGGQSLPEQFGVPPEIIRQVQDGELPMSAYSPYMEALHRRHVVAINSAFLIGDWIDIVFFGDKGWFFGNRKQLAKFPGLKVTCHHAVDASKYKGDHVKYLAKDNTKRKGLTRNPHKVCWNLNSGMAALSMIANMGARRIILLGFDMKLSSSGRQHFHGEYNRRVVKARKLPFERHMACLPHIVDDARKRRITIINASPDSAITVFTKITVKELLRDEQDS